MNLQFISRNKTKLLVVLLSLLAVLLVRIVLFFSHIHSPLNIQSTYILDVGRGHSLTRIVNTLEQENILSHSSDLLVYAKVLGLGANIKAGEYELNSGLNATALLTLLASGQVVYHQLRLGEGWTLRQALNNIQSHPAITVSLDIDDTQAIQDAFASSVYPEGIFFPDTYNFTRGTTDLEILQRAKTLMQQTLDQAWAARAVGLPYQTPFDALIMASIIEKETAVLAEQSLIAGVFIRRLQLNMRLQTDPSVIYGLGPEFNGNLTRADLLQDTPWNTYTRRGLPITPIALPGKKAIQASMNPDETEYLYFVAKGDGSHYFSATLEEHNQAVRRYQLNEQSL